MNESQLQPTLFGRVRHVLGAQVTAELLPDVAGTTPVYRGRVYQVGQIGSLVRIPQGTIDLIGAVTMLGIAELVTPTEPALVPQQGDRWIQFQLLGELDAFGRFQRGVSAYPGIEDPVHFATHEQVRAIFPPPSEGMIKLGSLSTSRGDSVHLDLGRLVMRHSAVVGSTGSGKSSTVARILQSVVASGLKRANVVVIDPHGEYADAIGDHGVVHSIGDTSSSQLSVPYWALPLDDLLQVYSRGTVISPVVKSRLQELVFRERQAFLTDAAWSAPSPQDITVDTPVPFDLRRVWHRLDYENRATYRQQGGQGQPCELNPGSADALVPAEFAVYGLGSTAPFKGRTYGHYSPLPDRLRTRMSDPRFAFLSREWPDPTQADPLPVCIRNWLGGREPISVLDFAGVPAEAADVAIGVILNLIFVAATSSAADEGVGRARPILVVLEEAHRFLGRSTASSAGLAREAVERIAREGRKYGVGLMLVSQRPAELSDTALSQCGTIIAMRLTNPTDQSSVRSALPDAITGLAEALPALRTGEALVTGEAITLPSRVLVDRPNPEPRATDPAIDSWSGEPTENDVEPAIARWRGMAPGSAAPSSEN
jgi:hypothetical protein